MVDRNEEEMWLVKNIVFTKKFMKENKDLLVLEADKDKATVVMEKKVYAEKMTKILENNED